MFIFYYRIMNDSNIIRILINLYVKTYVKTENKGNVWVAQLVKHSTLHFGSGHDLMVVD